MARYANDALALFDETWNIVDVNDRVRAIHGYAREELIGVNAHTRPVRLDDLQRMIGCWIG